ACMLLSFLAATIRRDAGYPGFHGSIAVGIRHAEGTTWWRAVFDDRGFSEVVDHRPDDVDACLLVTAEQAKNIMTGRLAELAPDSIIGDREIVDQFVKRYLRDRSAISVRAGARSD